MGKNFGSQTGYSIQTHVNKCLPQESSNQRDSFLKSPVRLLVKMNGCA